MSGDETDSVDNTKRDEETDSAVRRIGIRPLAFGSMVLASALAAHRLRRQAADTWR